MACICASNRPAAAATGTSTFPASKSSFHSLAAGGAHDMPYMKFSSSMKKTSGTTPPGK